MVATRDIAPGEKLTGDNIWVKRPGTGSIKAADYEKVLGKTASRRVPLNSQLSWDDIVER